MYRYLSYPSQTPSAKLDKTQQMSSSPAVTIAVFGLGAPSRFSPTILGSGVGGHAVRVAANEFSFLVRAVARDPSKYQEFYKDSPNVQLVQGDVTKPETLGECLKDCTAAIFSVTAMNGFSVMDVDRDGLINLARECAKLKVKLVVISAIFCSPKHAYSPARYLFDSIIKWNYLRAKWEGEEAVRQMQGLNYTIIRPATLTDGPPVQAQYKLSQGDNFSNAFRANPKVDIARVAVAACVDPAADKVTFECAGSNPDKPATIKDIFAGLKPDTT
jgi:uncharacterized protein YbjT (DUF2867 family)